MTKFHSFHLQTAILVLNIADINDFNIKSFSLNFRIIKIKF